MEEIHELASLKEKTLQIMLVELNNRSRWYSSELWQVPFAYLGLSGALITSVADEHLSYLYLSFLASTMFGIFVLIHMHRIRKNERRAINNLKAVEKALGLREKHTAKVREGWKIFQWLVLVAVFISALGAVDSLQATRSSGLGPLWRAGAESTRPQERADDRDLPPQHRDRP